MTALDKPSSETKVAPVRGIAMVLFIGAAVTGFGLIFWPLLIVGLLIFVVAIPVGLLSRAGSCPNCGEGVLLVGGNSKHQCSACKHRLVLRDKRLLDVT